LSPVRWVFNSHFHGDHTRGNQVFAQDAAILSTGLTRDAISNNMPRQLEADRNTAATSLAERRERLAATTNRVERQREQFWVDYFQAQSNTVAVLDPTPPNHSVDGTMVLHGSERSAVFRGYGGSHSGSDAILFVPGDSVLFAGGMVYNGVHPNMRRSHPEEWLQNLERLKLLGPQTVVPGHGAVGSSDLIDGMIQYIDDLSAIAVEVALADTSGIDITVPAGFENWLIPEFFPMNVAYLIERARSGYSNMPPDAEQ
jgi:glyoxylase-like metal-dependent hydrolase (beta-lactamase superfamily II)